MTRAEDDLAGAGLRRPLHTIGARRGPINPNASQNGLTNLQRTVLAAVTVVSVVHGSEVCTQCPHPPFEVRRCGHSSGVPIPACS
jgi:hypothetical protein